MPQQGSCQWGPLQIGARYNHKCLNKCEKVQTGGGCNFIPEAASAPRVLGRRRSVHMQNSSSCSRGEQSNEMHLQTCTEARTRRRPTYPKGGPLGLKLASSATGSQAQHRPKRISERTQKVLSTVTGP